ncbi:MAG: hypothetical protein JW895_09145 [Thermoleophilaceae bacterium]|nr:hypothetical protein [Thermoleophilaceae bacterium]
MSAAGPRRTARLAALAAGVLLAGLVAAVAWAAKDDTTLVSRVSGPNGAGADGNSYDASVSADGRYVAFESVANNLSGEDVDNVSDIFRRDLQTGVLTLVSRATGPAGAGGTTNSYLPSISADGRYVAFESGADNLSAEDNNTYVNVFVRDLQENTTTLVSRATGAAGTGGDDNSYDASISADGRYVAFESIADNLSPDDNNTYYNIFVRDLQENTTTLVSRGAGATGTGADGQSYDASISPDGRKVGFESDADNLSADDNNTYFNAFVRNLDTNDLTLVSRTTAGAAVDGDSSDPDPTNGGRVVFRSAGDNLSAEDDNTYTNVFVRDLSANTTVFASRANGPDGVASDASSYSVTISDDGRRVAFRTTANSISTEDNNAHSNVFVRDLVSATTTFVSRGSGAGGPAADDASFAPAISANGAFVGFESDADVLSDDDNNTYSNVFTRDIGAPPAAGGNGGGGNDTTKPRVSRVGMSRRRFKVGRKRTPISAAAKAGTTFRYTLSERSTVWIKIERALPGRRARKRSGPCRPPSRKRAGNRRCTRYKSVGTLSRSGEGPGRDSTAFSGRIGRRALKAGRYRATLRAVDGAGNRSSARRLGFRVVKR